jgi:hypothetical protein
MASWTLAAATCSNTLAVGAVCTSPWLDYYAPTGDCPSGTTCASEIPARDDGAFVCQAVSPCNADSDCPSNFGCSVQDGSDDSLTVHWYCATTCVADGTSYGCAAGSKCTTPGTCEPMTGQPCYVTDAEPLPCGVGAACAAATRVCTVPAPCTDASPCAGYACETFGPVVNKVCALSCATDMDCGPGFACNLETFACSSSLGGPCNPASDDASQCGAGGACSPKTRTCVAATPCADDGPCGSYGCLNGYCLTTCTENVVPCAVGSTCDLASNTCF